MAAAYLKTFSIVLLGIICTAEAGVYPNYHSFSELKPVEIPKKWWQTSSFYQIYPRSFKDSNGDGVGDLNGITEKLEYLREIGVNATWLSPIFTSPMADFGYDIANFTEIDPLFGTMQDFEALLAKAKRLGVRILLDFVPNHSSDEHEWFKKSASRDPEFKDFYVWHPGKMVNGVRKPPNNWVSVFHGSAWEWHPGRQEYYLHQFVKKQPDLNYRNPKVHEAMKEVLLFWLRKGVSGFRVDAVPHVYEVAPDADGNLPDEPTNDWNPDPDDYGHLNHIYTKDQPETIALVYEWRHVLDEFRKENCGDERILMAEAYSPIDVEMKYYGNATAEGAQVPFNFLIISWLTNSSDANHYVEAINTWLKNMPAGRTANWVVGNHDQSRVGSRLGRDRIDMMSMLILTLPGCSVTYNGEELGMTDVWISWNDTVDPSACNTNPSVYEKFSRDPERTPFQWSDETNAGFSSANKTWLPIAGDYKKVNVKVQRGEARSHLNVFKNLQAIRQDITIQNGDATIKAINNAVVAVKRSLINAHTFVTLMNIYDAEQKLDLNQVFSDMPKEFEYVVVTERSKAKIGDVIKSSEVQLLPKEAVVLKSTTKLATFAGYFTYYVSKS